MESTSGNNKKLWDRENKQLLYHTPIFDLVSYDVTIPHSGKIRPYYVLESKSWVNVIAITKDNQCILVRQYRHGLHEYSLELPGGVVDEEGSDAPLQSARRELVEETGYTSSHWKCIGKVSGNPAVFNNWCYTFLARDCEKTESTAFDEGEDIEIVLEDVSQLKEFLRNGKIHHSMMVAAIAHLLLSEEIGFS